MRTIKLLWARRVVVGVLLTTLAELSASQVSQQPETGVPSALLTQPPALNQAVEPVLNLAEQISWQQLPKWFSLRGENLTPDQQIKLWQTLAEIINLYAHPDLAQFERYLKRRGGFFPDQVQQVWQQGWQKRYQAGGVWTQIRGRGKIEVFLSEQPITPASASSYMQQCCPSESGYLALGRVSRYPGEDERPCLYARVCFVGVPPAAPFRTKEMILPKRVEGRWELERRQVAIDESARVYCLWLRWDTIVEQWWLDVVGVNNAFMRPDNYDLMF
jgi:hypothetical protein